MVKYQQKFGKDRFRLGRVVEVRHDDDGLVRTAWVGMRNLRRAIREEADTCRAGLAMVELPVQRLVLILPPEEQPLEVLAKLKDFPKMPQGRIKTRVDPQRQQNDYPEEVEAPAAPQVQVEVQDGVEEMMDLPRPQRARGRPKRAT